MIIITTNELNNISIDELIDRGERFTIKDCDTEENENGFFIQECTIST